MMSMPRIVPLAAAALFATACNEATLAPKPEPPVAVITGGESYAPLDTARFDGSGSYAQEGATIVAWDWSIAARPSGSTSTIVPAPADPARSDFWIDLSGDYVVSLTVTDDRGLTGTAEFPFRAVPWQKIHVELVWDTPGTDLDLHFVSHDEGGAFFVEPFDCFFQNTNPDWGTQGMLADDPWIDIDDVDGYGPENVNLNQPRDDHHYRVYVHYYADPAGEGATNATVRIFLSGELRYEGIMPLDAPGSAWEVATIHWPSGEIADVGAPFQYTP